MGFVIDHTRQAETLRLWFQRTTSSGARDPVTLYSAAFEAAWERARPALSDVTLLAVGERALGRAREKFPVLAGVQLLDGGFSLQGLRRSGAAESQIGDACWSLLAEFLDILGAISGEILTPALYAAIQKIGEAP